MVMVYSAAINSKDKNFRVIIANINEMLSNELIKFAKQFMKSLGLSLEIVNIDTSLNPTFENQFNLTVYSRLFLMDKLDEDFTWFDADLLLMPGWDQIFVNAKAEANRKTIIHGVLDTKVFRERLVKEQNRAYLRTDGRYVNAGVLKIHTKKWKNLHKEADWQLMAVNLENYGMSVNDQDIINYLCADHIKLMPSGFNYIVGDEILFQEHIFIKHYAGGPKPWRMGKSSKEFLMTSRGVQMFSPQDWNAQPSNAFLHYPMYWQVEDQLLSYLQDSLPHLYEPIVNLRNSTLIKLDRISQIKHFLIKRISHRFFP